MRTLQIKTNGASRHPRLALSSLLTSHKMTRSPGALALVIQLTPVNAHLLVDDCSTAEERREEGERSGEGGKTRQSRPERSGGWGLSSGSSEAQAHHRRRWAAPPMCARAAATR